MSKRKSRWLRLLCFVIVLLVLALIVGFVFKFTRIGKDITDLLDTSFRVECNGKTYKGDNNSIYLTKGEQARFVVKSANGYKVTIKPNVTKETDFIYYVDGVEYKFSETNLTEVFLSENNMQIGYFVLNIMQDYSLESVLSKLYEGKTVLVDVDIVNPYLLTITSGDTSITFEIFIVDIGISLDCGHIVF